MKRTADFWLLAAILKMVHRVNIVAQYKTSFKPDIYWGKTDEEIALEGEELAAGLTDEDGAPGMEPQLVQVPTA